MKVRTAWETFIKGLLIFCAALSVLSVLFITFFIVFEGVPLFFRSHTEYPPPSLLHFLFGTSWAPTETPPEFGILPFIAGSVMVTLGAMVFAVPIGIAAGIFIAEIARGRSQGVLRSTTEILAGIPSVVYGFFGVMMIGFFLGRNTDPLMNYNAFSAMIILAVMMLPTIITMTEVSIRAVPRDFHDASMALGASHWQTIWKVTVPAARGGIVTGVILGMGRAIGETMAVLMVAGNQPTLPMNGLRSRVRTLTMAIANDMGYAGGDHRVALFTTAIVLIIFILLLNMGVQMMMRRSRMQVQHNGSL